MKQEIIDKVKALSEIKESILRFLEDDSVLIGKGSYSKLFDCFMGSGTTEKMALQLNRHYIGFEVSEEYCKLSEKRVIGEKTQLKLF